MSKKLIFTFHLILNILLVPIVLLLNIDKWVLVGIVIGSHLICDIVYLCVSKSRKGLYSQVSEEKIEILTQIVIGISTLALISTLLVRLLVTPVVG